MPEAAIDTTSSTEQVSSVRKQLDTSDEVSLRDWIKNLVGSGSFHVLIERKTPTKYKGYIDTVEDEYIDEEYLKQNYGGGKYHLIIKKPNSAGTYVIFKHHTVTVAGPPKIEGATPVVQQPQDNGSTDRVLDVMERQLEMERDERLRIQHDRRRGGAHEAAYVETLMRPLREQLDKLTDANARLSERLADALNREPPKDEFKDGLLSKMFDSDNARLAALRDQHASELRTQRDRYETEIDRVRAQHKEDLRDLKRSHERELVTLERSMQAQIDQLKQMQQGLQTVETTKETILRGQIDALNRELTKAGNRIETLEAKKEKGLVETAGELAGAVESFKTLGLVKDSEGEGEGGPWYKHVFGALFSSDAFNNAMGSVLGAPAPSAELPVGVPQTEPPLNVPFAGPDGKHYIRRPDGIHEFDMEGYRRARARAKKDGTEAQSDGPRPPSADEVKIAVQFMENAIRNGTKPEDFATTAASLIPQDILGYIRHVGIDEFLNQVATLDSGSPLTTQAGRNFARKVGKFLTEGTTE